MITVMTEDELTHEELQCRYKYAADQTLIAALEAVRKAEGAWLKKHPTGVDDNGLTS